jgi:hypothetical protein
LDIHSVIYGYVKRMLPFEIIREKIDKFVEEETLEEEDKEPLLRQVQEMQAVARSINPMSRPGDSSATTSNSIHAHMTARELTEELLRREAALQTPPPRTAAENPENGDPGVSILSSPVTDQWRVYQEIIVGLQGESPLRMFMQASAGTGKSYLLEAVYLWCLMHGAVPEACAPTGIAAARLHVPRTGVHATTVHNLFQLNLELESKLDPSKGEDAATLRLIRMTILIIDEVSMLDDFIWKAIKDQLSSTGHRSLAEHDLENSKHPRRDDFGRVHILLSGDLKQLPPATGRPPMIGTDFDLLRRFTFRVLRQNRRLAPASDPEKQKDLDDFHQVLEDISMGNCTTLARKHIVAAYVRGAKKNALRVPIERGTACFSKRSFRDRWNKIISARAAKKYGRSLKIKAAYVSATHRDTALQGRTVENIRRVVRSQSLDTLHLAGQWQTDDPLPRQRQPYFMRAMLVANIDVENRFANGTQGRIVWWGPDVDDPKADPVSGLDPEVSLRFVHEDALRSGQRDWLSGVDFIDVMPRREEVPNARGKPYMVQAQLQPANALTIHKVQALTIREEVFGCFEGVFAHGQVYVLWSRVTDPLNFHLVGLPPVDMLEDVARAWAAAGLDVDECMTSAVEVLICACACVRVCLCQIHRTQNPPERILVCDDVSFFCLCLIISCRYDFIKKGDACVVICSSSTGS